MSEEGRCEWCFDMALAPKGSWHVTTRTVKGEIKEFQHEKPDWIWIATEDGHVGRHHWSKPARKNDVGRWAGLADSQKPIAWMWFEKPQHPTIGASNET